LPELRRQSLDGWAMSRLHNADERREELGPGISLLAASRLGRSQSFLNLITPTKLNQLTLTLSAGLQAMLAFVLATQSNQFLNPFRAKPAGRGPGRVNRANNARDRLLLLLLIQF
jgi:hypothetical protein